MGQACGLPPHDLELRAAALCLRLMRGVLPKLAGLWRVWSLAPYELCGIGEAAVSVAVHSHESIWRHNNSARIKHSYHDVICARRRWPLALTHLWSTHCLSWRAAAARSDGGSTHDTHRGIAAARRRNTHALHGCRHNTVTNAGAPLLDRAAARAHRRPRPREAR